MEYDNITVIICCAGMGTRLGIGTTKTMLDICGKPLILHQLDMLEKFDDIRIVLGYQAEKVLEVVKEIRDDVMFAFNYDYESTGVAASLQKGLLGAREYVIYLDGDLLINKADFIELASHDKECVAVSTMTSEEVVRVEVNNGRAIGFSNEGGYVWPGLAKIKSSGFKIGEKHVFDMIKPCLPLDAIFVRAKEINTPDDYERAVEWFSNGRN